MTLSEQMTRCGGRRFVLTLGGCIVHTGLFLAGLLTEGGFITLILAHSGAYIAGNGFQKYHAQTSDGDSL